MINRNNWKSYFSLLIVYVVWGSTYLGIRIAVRAGSGFSPFSMGFTRTLCSGIILLAIAKIKKEKFSAPKRDVILALISGIFLWTFGNGLLIFGEQDANSGLASIILGSLPLWMVLLESIIDKKLPSGKMILFIAIGFFGISYLALPNIQAGGSSATISIIALIFAPFVWGIGSLIVSRNKINLSINVIAAYQMLAGSFGFLVLTFLTNEPFPNPIKEAWFAWVYLVVIGGVIAYRAYVAVLKQLPMKIVTTYAYVNPVIAVILGWILLGEEVTSNLLVGSFIVLLSVAGIFKEKYQ